MFTILKKITYENLIKKQKKDKEKLIELKKKNLKCYENYNAVVHLASKKSLNALKTLRDLVNVEYEKQISLEKIN